MNEKLLKLVAFILIPLYFLSFGFASDFKQEDLRKSILTIEKMEKSTERKKFKSFLSSNVDVLEGLDFNIKNVTAISKMEPIHRPGLTPDWGTAIFESMDFENIVFKNCNFKYLNFSKARFKNTRFIHCNFEGTIFDEAQLKHVLFKNCKLTDASFFRAELKNSCFINNKVDYANFMEATFYRVQYLFNSLQGSNFFKSTANMLSLQEDLQDILFYPHEKNTNTKKPIILISYETKKPALAVTKIIQRIREDGGIPFKFNYADPDIDCVELEKEVQSIIEQIRELPHTEKFKYKSLPKKIFEIAKEQNFPELAKIQKKAFTYVQVVSGVILPGGQDIQPFFYGQEPHPKTSITHDLRRDLLEFAILDELEKRDIPLLGVCRGMQVANVWRGGTLKQHIEGHLFQIQQYHLVDSDSVLASIFISHSQPLTGYSFHHQAVDTLGRGLKTVVLSEDGTIKALEMPKKNFWAFVQWHPECKGDRSTPEAEQLDAKLSEGNLKIYQQFIKATLPTSRMQ